MRLLIIASRGKADEFFDHNAEALVSRRRAMTSAGRPPKIGVALPPNKILAHTMVVEAIF